jgi:hypothetical protein
MCNAVELIIRCDEETVILVLHMNFDHLGQRLNRLDRLAEQVLVGVVGRCGKTVLLHL